MTFEEIKRWAATEPPAVQQYVGELVGMVDQKKTSNARLRANIERMIASKQASRKIIRKACFLEAAEIAENEYTGPGHNLASTRAICFVISEALRQRAEEGK